jgi:hypothetical protein
LVRWWEEEEEEEEEAEEIVVYKGQDFGTTDKDGSFAKFFFTVIQRSLLYQLLDLCNEVFGKFWNNSKSP